MMMEWTRIRDGYMTERLTKMRIFPLLKGGVMKLVTLLEFELPLGNVSIIGAEK